MRSRLLNVLPWAWALLACAIAAVAAIWAVTHPERDVQASPRARWAANRTPDRPDSPREAELVQPSVPVAGVSGS